MADVDSFVFEAGPQPLAKTVIADAPDHEDVGPQTRGGDRLVGSFAAGQFEGLATDDRLARSRKPRRADDKVHVDRTGNDDSGST